MSDAGPFLPDVGVLALDVQPWSPRWQSRQHVLSRLARRFHVLHLPRAPAWREALRSPPGVPGPQPLPPGLQLHRSPAWLPRFYRPRWLAGLAERARLAEARSALRAAGCRRLVAYLWRPEFEAALDAPGFDLRCYHVDDEYSFSEEEVPISAQEERVLRGVDRVFLTSPALYEKKGGLNPRSLQIPNGVDAARFSRACPVPADLATVPRPRIGYTGWLKRQLDWPLLQALAHTHPEWSFVFVGARAEDPDLDAPLAALGALPNVHLLGAKTSEELAAYPQHLDVCLLPYRRNAYTHYIYPLKIHEYLAGGRPVVGAPIRSLQDLGGDVLDLADSLDDWSDALARALTPESCEPARVEARRAVARRHDWDALVAQIAASLAEGLGPDVAERLSRAEAES